MPTIYQIRCCSGDTYIGSTCQAVGRRFNEHRSTLRRGNHRNPSLQRLWNLHGEGAFTFAALATCEESTRKAVEQSWIDATPGSLNVYSTLTSTYHTRKAKALALKEAALAAIDRRWEALHPTRSQGTSSEITPVGELTS